MPTPDSINAAQKAKVAKKYPGSTSSTDIYIGGSPKQPGRSGNPNKKRGPRLPVFKVREVRDKMA